ncbi:MAG TPA: hypothetical protein VE954_38410 [Oligoflexus sp.]|uniref:hypothetical protein n=1 Tax=Oligoflexus sp. TaxID=1971216 RepID=UPI002D716684|nr:hypothetical protein [Oligoflexus sp.]HYX39014.1 hypothetical protein [Oligoflexus sp.]
MKLTSSHNLGLGIATVILLASCQDKKDLSGEVVNKGSLNSIDRPTGGDPEDERVDPPANIVGTYLYCSEVNVPFDADGASTIGCALYDETTNARVEVRSIAANIDWAYDGSKISIGTTVSLFNAANNPSLDYDVYFSFSGFSVSFADVLAAFIIKMNVTDLNGKFQSYINTSFMEKGAKSINPSAPTDVIASPLK